MMMMLPLLLSGVLLLASTAPFATAFATVRAPPPVSTQPPRSSSSSSIYGPRSTNARQRKRRTTPLASRRRGDIEDRIVSIRDSWKVVDPDTTTTTTVYQSDVPSSDDDGGVSGSKIADGAANLAREFKDRFLKLPPPPEDQFIMTGDIAILFLYAFTSHSINDSVVGGLLADPSKTIPEAVRELDPLHDVVSLQHPVWVDLASNPNIPFGNPAVDRALEVSAREGLMNHYGPLFTTDGSACVALCICWLIAGWFHRAFLFDNSTYCYADRALTKTVETWLTSALLLAAFATGADWLVGHVPVLQSLLCVTCKSAANAAGGAREFQAAMSPDGSFPSVRVSFLSLTQSDVLFIVDSLTVLIAWRWCAHRVLNVFR